ncbi:MAG: nitrilase-related carbon-nitrogen hydrolase [Rhodospirillaceae bacterium]|nr:nitrilase-related carbon-nitrogen hydrolase [Rhodospirillaceae bacterium]
MLVISQKSWSTNSYDDVGAEIAVLAAACRRRNPLNSGHPMVLLPLAELVSKPPALADLSSAMGAIAKTAGAYVAGAARVRAEGGPGHHVVGFLFGDDGQSLLSMPKVSPSLVEGFVDGEVAALGAAARFPIARTPIGQVGVLAGEDLLFPHLVRSLVWAGAEVILHPTIESNDHLLPARRNARAARAFENTAYVVTASAAVGPKGESRPSTSGLVDWMAKGAEARSNESAIFPDLDIEKLRRRRHSIFSVQPLHLRANLFADGYKKLAQKRPTVAPQPKSTDAWIAEAKKRLAAASEAPPAPAGSVEHYDVILTQNIKKIIQRESNVDDIRRENILEAMKLPARLASNPAVRLVVFGEFFMTGQGGHGYRSPLTLQRLAVRYPGPELELLQDFALKHKTYVAGSSFEIDDKLPGHVFNSAFILNDSGDLIHRYRKIQCADVWGSLPDTTPSSVYDRYLDAFGYDFLFPVANTPLGRLATMVCFDQAHPEVARMLTQYGAEVIIHPSSEGHGSGRAGWDLARQTRAFENTAYILSAMPGGIYFNPADTGVPSTQMRGHTKIVNFDGSIQGVADGSGPCILQGNIDLKALRRARANPLTNLVIWDDPATYVDQYAQNVGLANNLWGPNPLENPYVGFAPLKKVLKSYYERGIFVPPASVDAPTASAQVAPPVKKLPSSLTDLKKMDGEFIQI